MLRSRAGTERRRITAELTGDLCPLNSQISSNNAKRTMAPNMNTHRIGQIQMKLVYTYGTAGKLVSIEFAPQMTKQFRI